MATARERLIQALTTIISQPFSNDGLTSLNRLLNSYRVQAKPGTDSTNNQTARDALADLLVDAWKKNPAPDKKSLYRIISAFRMQLKQGLSRGRIIEPKTPIPDGQNLGGNHLPPRAKIRENRATHENAYFRDKYSLPNDAGSNAIAGGPKQGSNTRGQCPKCRSFGIVLARAYGGDDYHSCIYCGYQAYLKDADPHMDLPLAAGLLHALKEPKVDDED